MHVLLRRLLLISGVDLADLIDPWYTCQDEWSSRGSNDERSSSTRCRSQERCVQHLAVAFSVGKVSRVENGLLYSVPQMEIEGLESTRSPDYLRIMICNRRFFDQHILWPTLVFWLSPMS